MKIFFDHQAFSLQNYGGISRYFCELISGINKTGKDEAHLSLLWSNNFHLKEYQIPVLSYPFQGKHRLLDKTNSIYNFLDFKAGKYDLYHATYFNDFLKRYTGSTPIVATFHDMTYERLSNQFIELSTDSRIISQKKEIAQLASQLIAVSESTKQDMIELLGIAPEKIKVIHLSSPFLLKEASTNNETSANAPYLLYVGNRSGYKNFLPLLKAIAPVLIRHQISIVCAGGGKFTKNEKDIINSLSIDKLVKYKAIDDTILQTLYQEAVALVFPSLYEGFGIPILEAFACNCPCLISNTSSLPEVAGDAALYFDPTNAESMAVIVESIIMDTELRHKMIKCGRQQLARYSWQNTVSDTLDLYHSLI